MGLSASDLRSAIASIKAHVEGSTTLTYAELKSARELFMANSAYLDMDFDSMNDAFALVDSYESEFGGMFINSRSDKWGFPRDDTNDGYSLERTMLVVQQALLDEIYQGTLQDIASQIRIHDPVVENCKDYLRGRHWKTSTYFPGELELPAEQNTVEYSVKVNATVGEYWGIKECFSDSPAIHATGYYLPPGGVAWLIFPPALVDQGFQIQVGANDADTRIKEVRQRMDRVTCTYEVTSTTTYVSSPLGGGIYIKVPYLADYGRRTIRLSGDVIQAPFFCKFLTLFWIVSLIISFLGM